MWDVTSQFVTILHLELCSIPLAKLWIGRISTNRIRQAFFGALNINYYLTGCSVWCRFWTSKASRYAYARWTIKIISCYPVTTTQHRLLGIKPYFDNLKASFSSLVS